MGGVSPPPISPCEFFIGRQGFPARLRRSRPAVQPPQRGCPRCFPGETASGFPRTPISGAARKDECGYYAPLIFRRPAFDAACFAAASALAALLLALRSLGPKVLWAHLRRFKRLGAAYAAFLPRLAAQNRSHAGCALAGDPLASSGKRRLADKIPPRVIGQTAACRLACNRVSHRAL